MPDTPMKAMPKSPAEIEKKFKQHALKTLASPYSPLTRRRENPNDPNSPWLITVNLDVTTHDPRIKKVATEISSLTTEQKEAIHNALEEIEGTANIKFVFPQYYQQKNSADIFISQGSSRSDTESFAGVTYINETNTREIIITNAHSGSDYRSGEAGYSVILHELGHALGLEHPNKDPSDPRHSLDDTVMSISKRNPDTKKSVFPSIHLRPMDRAVLQAYYGPSQKKKMASKSLKALENKEILDLRDLSTISTLDNSKLLSLDLSASALGRQVKDVITSPQTTVNIDLTGNDLPNKLQGGSEWSYLTARGGGDQLTSRGSDTDYEFNGKSGLNNIVTHFRGSDEFLIKPEITRLQLHWRENIPYENTLANGTHMRMFNDKNELLASAFVIGAKPSQVKASIRNDRKNIKPLEITDTSLEPAYSSMQKTQGELKTNLFPDSIPAKPMSKTRNIGKP